MAIRRPRIAEISEIMPSSHIFHLVHLELFLNDLKQKDDEEPEKVEHEEEEDGVVAQGLEVSDELSLVRLVRVDRIEVLVDQLAPELSLDRVEQSHGSGAEVSVARPVRVD